MTGSATDEVTTRPMRSAAGVHERPVGVDGFFIQGVTHTDPITGAHALDRYGYELPGPLLL